MERSDTILLFNPGSGGTELHPLGLLYLAAVARQAGHKIAICDEDEHHNFIKFVQYYKPTIFAATALTPLVSQSYSLCDFFNKHLFTVLGGHHVSALPLEGIKHADAVVIGEGEDKFLDIISSKSGGIYDGISTDLDSLPMPAYDLIDMDFYALASRRIYRTLMGYVPPSHKVLAIMTSRGCPHRCIYCHNSLRKSPLRYFSPERVVKEIKYLVDTYHLNAIHFNDDDFFVNKNRLDKIFSLMREDKIKVYWSSTARATDITDEKVQMAKENNCVCLSFGFESTSDRILQILEKHQTFEDVKNAVAICKKYDMIIQSGFMIGNPTETIDEMLTSVNYCFTEKLDGANGAFITTPYPGTKIWEYCKDKNLVSDKMDWNRFRYDSIVVPMSTVDNDTLFKLFSNVNRNMDNLYGSMFDIRMEKISKCLNRMNI